MKKVLLFTVLAIVLAFGFSSTAFADTLLNVWGVTPGSDWDPMSGVLSEKSVGTLNPGSGDHPFDAEAMYLYHDSSYGYIALVTGMGKDGSIGNYPPPGENLLPGDFALNFGGTKDSDNNLIYQYGVRTTSNTGSGGVGGTPGDIYTNIDWGKSYEWNAIVWGGQNNPTVIKSGLLVGSTVFNYYSVAGADALTHYVYEASIPLNIAGMDWPSGGSVHWSMTCGNDASNVNFPGIPNTVPEPISTTLFLLGGGAMGLRIFRRKKA